MGGEKSSKDSALVYRPGSPPRGRGKGKFDETKFINTGITPAWARKRHFCDSGFKGYGDHPRVGGEKADIDDDGLHYKGSPPRGRGKGAISQRNRPCPRITPAWAGKSICLALPITAPRDHPRVGGEKRTISGWSTKYWGSPPRRRGKADVLFSQFFARRITPALAGKRCTANGCHLK